MTTKQSNTTALTDEQLKGVAGGFVKYVHLFRFVSETCNGESYGISPVPTPIPGARMVSREPLPSPSPRSGFTRVGFRGCVPRG